MKRKIILIFIFLMFIFIPSVRAEDNMKVIFNTSFEEQIDLDDIDAIYIMMDDANHKDYQIVLRKKNNFYSELTNLPSGVIYLNSLSVAKDYTVDYDIEYVITQTSDEEMVVSLLVKKIEKDPNRERVQITEEELAEMLGYDPLSIVTSDTTTSISTTTTTTEDDNDSNEPIDISPNRTTTTATSTLTDEEIKAQEKEQEALEKEEASKKRNHIYLIVILVIVAIILVFGIITGVKIANANK